MIIASIVVFALLQIAVVWTIFGCANKKTKAEQPSQKPIPPPIPPPPVHVIDNSSEKSASKKSTPSSRRKIFTAPPVTSIIPSGGPTSQSRPNSPAVNQKRSEMVHEVCEDLTPEALGNLFTLMTSRK